MEPTIQLQSKSQNYTSKNAIEATSMDICFLIDITKSMKKHLETTMKALKELTKTLEEIFEGKIRIGFVGYRDMEEENPGEEQFEWIDLDQYNPEEIEQSKLYKKWNSIICSGGGDFSEDVSGGIKKSLEVISWNAESKYLILITDAPAHGVKYNQGYKDNHPDQSLDSALQLLIQQYIKFIVLEVSDYTKTMVEEIEKFYRNKKVSNFFEHQRIGVSSVGEISKMFCKSLIETIKKLK